MDPAPLAFILKAFYGGLCRKSTSSEKPNSICSGRKPCRRQRQATLLRHQERAASK